MQSNDLSCTLPESRARKEQNIFLVHGAVTIKCRRNTQRGVHSHSPGSWEMGMQELVVTTLALGASSLPCVCREMLASPKARQRWDLCGPSTLGALKVNELSCLTLEFCPVLFFSSAGALLISVTGYIS